MKGGPSPAPAPSAPLLCAVGLEHRYRSGRAGLRGVDLEVAPGERVVLLGPNGSGKTTLTRILATDLEPTAGRVTFFGGFHRASPAVRRRLGIALDRPAHIEPLTGRENATLFGRASGAATDEVELDALFDRFALEADVPVSSYSLGMRRKLLLVEALLHEPEFIVFDEPTLGLDPPSVDALVELLEEQTVRDTAAVIAINDPLVAARLATRVVFLDGGSIVADDDPGTLLAAADTRTVCSIELDHPISGPPVQLPGVQVTSTQQGLHARFEEGLSALPALVAGLVDTGGSIRSLRVREPDLRDVFRELTGRHLEPSPAAESEESPWA